MTFEELLAPLPWGLHDAWMEALEIDWMSSELHLTMRLMMSKHQDVDQRARITVTGLVYCLIEGNGATPMQPVPPGQGLWIDGGSGIAPGRTGASPPTPDGCFVCYIYERSNWQSIQLCGREASLTWLEPASVAARQSVRAALPGEQIPDR